MITLYWLLSLLFGFDLLLLLLGLFRFFCFLNFDHFLIRLLCIDLSLLCILILGNIIISLIDSLIILIGWILNNSSVSILYFFQQQLIGLFITGYHRIFKELLPSHSFFNIRHK